MRREADMISPLLGTFFSPKVSLKLILLIYNFFATAQKGMEKWRYAVIKVAWNKLIRFQRLAEVPAKYLPKAARKIDRQSFGQGQVEKDFTSAVS